jgi:hypothetical protein
MADEVLLDATGGAGNDRLDASTAGSSPKFRQLRLPFQRLDDPLTSKSVQRKMATTVQESATQQQTATSQPTASSSFTYDDASSGIVNASHMDTKMASVSTV